MLLDVGAGRVRLDRKKNTTRRRNCYVRVVKTPPDPDVPRHLYLVVKREAARERHTAQLDRLGLAVV